MIKAIAIVIVMLVVNVLMLFSIRRAALRVDYTLRRLFMQKISLEETEKDEERSSEESVPEKENPEQESQIIIKNVIISSSDTLKPASFKSSSLRDDYRTIRQVSEYTPEKALDCTRNQMTDSAPEIRKDYSGVLQKLTMDAVYELASLEPGQQETILRETLSPQQSVILDDYLAEDGKRFDAVGFFSFVKQMNEICGTDFIIKTGNMEDDGRILPDGTKLKYDESICEGSQVIYGNKLYDYSI